MEQSCQNLSQIVHLNVDQSEITEDDPLNICDSTQEYKQIDLLQSHEVENGTDIIGLLPRDILREACHTVYNIKYARKDSLKAEEKRLFKCGVCGETFDEVSDFKAHAKSEHKGQEYFDCFRAKEKSVKTQEFVHEEKRPYICGICFIPFDHANQLKYHVYKLHSHEEKINYKCGICYETFDDANLFMLHAKVHEEKKRDYKCGICYETFDKAALFKQHANSMHKEKRQYNFKCGICYETFDQEYLFQLHANSIHNMGKNDALVGFSKKVIDIYNQSLGVSVANEQKKKTDDKESIEDIYNQSLGISFAKEQKKKKDAKEFVMSSVQQTNESPVMRKDAAVSIDIYNQSLGQRKQKKDAKEFVMKMSTIHQTYESTIMKKSTSIANESKDSKFIEKDPKINGNSNLKIEEVEWNQVQSDHLNPYVESHIKAKADFLGSNNITLQKFKVDHCISIDPNLHEQMKQNNAPTNIQNLDMEVVKELPVEKKVKWTCYTCNITFDTKTSLKSHLNIHVLKAHRKRKSFETSSTPISNEKKKKWNCSICDSELKHFAPFFKSEESLNLHIATAHVAKKI